ncbi:receptor-type tyrosine-protein phosphatase F-like isoform X2 [Eriocheir sinensis]|uniref:receptor-type tyrosine-protein phosphatase F-like isoform X2 n=1 Tax=Eriocheir sinensis TaxID=95602 RepID=UPI0021C79A8B|nr:receptor-type tyrosine-protein phosphatase F-like isoform X2 [Eriocheir sinensis]
MISYADSQDSLVEESDDNPEPTVTPCKDGDSRLPRFKNPPSVTSITANSAMVGLTPWTTQYYIGEMPDGSQPSFVLQFWPVRYPRQCDLQYRLKVEKKRGNNRFIKDHVTEEVHASITNLQPYTDYLVMVQSKSGGKYSDITYTTVKTLPSKPGKVTGLRKVEANGTSLLVTWDHPQDNPPKGELESFKVSWGVIGVTTGYKSRKVGLQKRCHITNLNPGTTYTIKVRGKNKDVGRFGEPAEIIATTTQGVPPKVVGLTNPNATVSWLTVSWKTPNTKTGITSFYNVKLRPAPAAASTNDSPQWNKTVHKTQAEFDGLEAGTKYTVQVRACNSESCGDTLVGDVWTRPAPPRLLEEGVDLGEATGATMTIQLPLLANPPGWHYVMVQRQGTGVSSTNLEQELMNTARALVKEENNQTRQRRSVDSPIMYIAAKLQQEDDTRLQVTLGDNKTSDDRYYNQPLEKGAAYWTLVVTEKRSGSWNEMVCSVPRRFVAAPNNTFEGLGLAAGMATMLLVIAALAIVCIKKRHQLRVKMTRDRIVNDYPLATLRGDPYFLPLEHHNKGEGDSPTLGWNNSCPSHVSQDPAKEDIYANATLLVSQKDLEAYLLRAVLSAETKEEFAKVPILLSSNTSASSLPENRTKNRYRMNVTYDETRVVLPLYDNIPHSDYINANFIEGPGRRDAFIATQGPKEETVGAFWRMVWHTQCPAIVMVANLTERGKVKVTQYWPERQTLLAEGLTVTPGSVTSTMDFVIRIFILSDGSTQRQVTHYQYIAWPDHGVPQMAYGLANMLKKVRLNHDNCHPITVHCSAGIGRTGTVILVLYLLEQLKAGSELNTMIALSTLRRGRGRLVENIDQYIFAHQVLNEVLFGLDTALPCHSFDKKLSAIRSPQAPNGISPLQQQFKKLKSLPKDMSFKYAKDPAVASLNRNKDILPADCRLLFVPSLTSGLESRYLNVVRINGADMKDAYIAGEHPQTHTLAKMWSLVHEKEIGAWLMMHDFPAGDMEFPQVVCDSSLLQNMTLTASEPRSFDHYKEQEVDISLFSLGKVRKHRCVLLTLKGWAANHSLPASPRPLISLIERTLAIPRYKQILMTCRDGVTNCSVVAALLVP